MKKKLRKKIRPILRPIASVKLKLKKIGCDTLGDYFEVQYKFYFRPIFLPIVFIIMIPTLLICSIFMNDSFKSLYSDCFINGWYTDPWYMYKDGTYKVRENEVLNRLCNVPNWSN